jgi:hypothetical protein
MYPCSHCRPHFQKDYDKGILYLIKIHQIYKIKNNC